jgi:hypothetical protein
VCLNLKHGHRDLYAVRMGAGQTTPEARFSSTVLLINEIAILLRYHKDRREAAAQGAEVGGLPRIQPGCNELNVALVQHAFCKFGLNDFAI